MLSRCNTEEEGGWEQSLGVRERPAEKLEGLVRGQCRQAVNSRTGKRGDLCVRGDGESSTGQDRIGVHTHTDTALRCAPRHEDGTVTCFLRAGLGLRSRVQQTFLEASFARAQCNAGAMNV